MPSAQGISSAVERAESTDASVGASVPRRLESVHVGRIRNGEWESAGLNSCLRVTRGHSSVKFAHATVGRCIFDFELPDPASEELELIFHRFLAH